MEALYQLSYSPNKNLYATRQTRRQTIRQLTYEAPTDERNILIQAFIFVEPTGVIVKNMNHNTAVVDQDPLLLRDAFTLKWRATGLNANGICYRITNRAHLALVASARNDKQICNR